MPPVPVVTPTPAPVRLNQVSRVKVVTPRAEALAEGHVVVRAVELQRRAGGQPTASPTTSFDAGEALPEPSTAMTT